MKSIKEIVKEFEEAGEEMYPALLEEYESDTRSGVQKLLLKIKKKREDLEKEIARTESMKKYEHQYEHLGYLCGIDEVGRGPLAGPVVACAVILPTDCKILYLNDSKKLTAKKREELYEVIQKEAVGIGIGMRSPQRIDEINILPVSIAAASIVAKVTRDRMMEEYDKLLPEYGFADNKGYGSAAHIAALKKYGPTPIHRKSFISHFV